MVAGEVKDLARETAGTTDRIAGLIEAIRRDIGDAVQAIGSITAVIADVDPVQQALIEAVEQRRRTTDHMSTDLSVPAPAGSSFFAS